MRKKYKLSWKPANRHLAAILLVFSALVFVLAIFLIKNNGATLWLSLLKAVAEGALVGGIADWFAVTALFRYPLGVKLPHTAILPNKKAELGRRLGHFIREHFLHEDLLAKRVRHWRILRRLILGIYQNVDTKQRSKFFAQFQEILQDKKQQTFIQTETLRLLKKIICRESAPKNVGKVLERLVNDGLFKEYSTQIAQALGNGILSISPSFEQKIKELVPDILGFLREPVFRALMRRVFALITEMEDDPNHKVWQSLEKSLLEYAQKLQNDAETQAKMNALLRKFANSHNFAKQWRSFIDDKLHQLGNDEKPVPVFFLRQILRSLALNKELVAKLENITAHAIAIGISSHAEHIEDFLASEIARWDTEQISNIIEDKIGDDLQWIRVNGSIVGAGAGGVIYLIAKAIAF